MNGGRQSRVALLRGGSCYFQKYCPHKYPHVFGGIILIPTLNAVPDKALQANELAMLNSVGDISEDVHTYVLVA